MKSRLLILMVVAALLISAVGGGLVAAQGGETVTLEFWQHEGGTKITGMTAVIEGFEALYPEIDVI